MTADQIIQQAIRESIAAYRLGRRIDRHVPTTAVARALELAADEAAACMAETPQHLGAVYEFTWAVAA